MTTKAAPGQHQEKAHAKVLRDTPAHNFDAEKIVLGAMAMKESARDHAISRLSAADFYSLPHSNIFEAMAAMHNAGSPVDMVTLADALRKSADRTRATVNALGVEGLTERA